VSNGRREGDGGPTRWAAEGLDTITLTSWVYYQRPGPGWWTDQHQQSVIRRALLGLARRRLVYRLGVFRGPRCHWRVYVGRRQQ
jgi:hypothetical protein